MNRLLGYLQTPVLLIAITVLAALAGNVSGLTVYRVATIALISVVFCVGLWLFSGNSGVMSFGHVAFMALGAYAMAYLTIPVPLKKAIFSGLPPGLSWLASVHAGFWPAVGLSAAAAAVLAIVTSPVVARLSGLQSGIATLAMLVIVYNVIDNWTAVTRGSSSMIGVPLATTTWSALLVAVVTIAAGWAYRNSRSGLQLRASRDDYWAAQASGISVGRHRAIAWVLSAAICGAAGALYAAFLAVFSISGFFLSATFGFVVMVVLGGYLSLSGAVIGALGVSVLQEVLRRLQDGELTGGSALPPGTANLILAAVLLLVLIKAPHGLMGTREIGFRPRASRKTTESAPSDPVPAKR